VFVYQRILEEFINVTRKCRKKCRTGGELRGISAS
jgi:hypothetical protein